MAYPAAPAPAQLRRRQVDRLIAVLERIDRRLERMERKPMITAPIDLEKHDASLAIRMPPRKRAGAGRT